MAGAGCWRGASRRAGCATGTATCSATTSSAWATARASWTASRSTTACATPTCWPTRRSSPWTSRRTARRASAARLLETWSRALGESHPPSLADHYVAYRAHVRAKVACLRRAQGDERAGAEARRLHALCLRHLERARVRLVLVGGAPGTGKSTVAAGVAERLGWTVLRSDATRRSLHGALDPGGASAAYGEGRYSPERRAEVYAALLGDARPRLALGESVIIDASWSAAAARERALEVAEATRSELVEIRCSAPAEVGQRRIVDRAGRGEDPSEATPEIARRLAADADPWPWASALDTDRSLADTLADALRLVA